MSDHPSPRLAIAFSFAQNYLAIAISLVSVIILARLMTPEEVGIFSVSVALVSIVHQLRDGGISSYIIQEKELTKRRFQSAFGVILSISWFLAALVFFTRNIVADFYNKPGIASVLAIISINFLLIPFGATIRAVLQRDMMFGKLFIINTSGAVAGSVTSIVLAYMEFGYMSLAWGSLSTTAMTVLTSFYFKTEITYFMPRFHEWRRVTRIGIPVVLINLLNTFAYQAPELIIGKVIDFSSVGIYSRARGQVNLFYLNIMSSITSVLFPLLAKKHRNHEPIAEPYLKIVTYTTGLSWPFYAGLGILCFPVTRVMFGDQWDAAIPLIQILCFAQAIGTISPIHGNLLTVLGKVKLLLKLEMVIQIISISLYAGTVFYGLEYVAFSRVPFYGIVVVFYFAIIRKFIFLKFIELFSALVPSFILLLCSIVGPLIVMNYMIVDAEHVWLPFWLGGSSLVVGWCMGLLLSNHPLKDEFILVVKSIRKLAFK